MYRVGKVLRLSEFIDIEDGRSVIADASLSLSLGPMRGLEDAEEGVNMVIRSVDAVVLSPGEAERLAHLFQGKEAPALLVRTDWSNAFRNESFVLPARKIAYAVIAKARDALTLGASSIMMSFFIGYGDDEDEARNLRSISMLARECSRVGLPIIVEAIPVGELVTDANYIDCISVAVRTLVETGADIVCAPYTGDPSSFQEVVESAKVPVLICDKGAKMHVKRPLQEYLNEALKAGAKGVVCAEEIFQAENPTRTIEDLAKKVHERRIS